MKLLMTTLARIFSSFILIVLIILCALNSVSAQYSYNNIRPRIVITADPELDDNNSLIRFLLYSDELQIEGLIYASSGYHWAGDGKGTKWYVTGREYSRFGLNLCPCESWRWAKNEHFIHSAVAAYGKSYQNLKIHNPNYPTPEYLMSKIRYGNIEFDGDISKDSPGSELIKSLILDDKPGQLFITAWGGQSTIARALKSIQEQYEYTLQWEMIKKKISRKVVLLPSGDQDDTYANYIKLNWPDIEYRQFIGGPSYSYGAQLSAKGEDSIYYTSLWMKKNISDRGALGAVYRVWGDGKQMVKDDKLDYFGLTGYTEPQLRKMGYVVWMPIQEKGSWLGEGDSGTFMDMLGNGLNAYEADAPGGWGGRITGKDGAPDFSIAVLDSVAKDTNAKNKVSSVTQLTKLLNKNAKSTEYPDFFPAAELDFAARLKWSVTPKYSDANHPPVVKIEGPKVLVASPGEKIRINAVVSDPDGDTVLIKWWQFITGTDNKIIDILNPASAQTDVLISKEATPGQTIYLIIEAKDNGTPAITRYQRVNIIIKK